MKVKVKQLKAAEFERRRTENAQRISSLAIYHHLCPPPKTPWLTNRPCQRNLYFPYKTKVLNLKSILHCKPMFYLIFLLSFVEFFPIFMIPKFSFLYQFYKFLFFVNISWSIKNLADFNIIFYSID